MPGHKHISLHCLITCVILCAAVLTMPSVTASGLDLHWLWHDRCAACHGHSGDFARRVLDITSGELQGRHHVHDLRTFLHNHYLSGREVDAIYNMLLAQVKTQARFQNECSGCHGSAAVFVRESLILRDGVLYCRNRDTTVHHFLDNHGDLSQGDVGFYTDVLTRIAHEVYRP